MKQFRQYLLLVISTALLITTASLHAINLTNARVFTSQWCRCVDTATYLGLSESMVLPLISSFFQERHKGSAQTQRLKAWIAT